MKNRAVRRHHNERLRAKRSKYNTVALDATEKRVGKALHTACACSCWMCGNPRRHFGERTVQEKRNAQ